MSAAAGRMLWASSAAGSLLIHAAFVAVALSVVPQADVPRPEPVISVADIATGFAADVAAPAMEEAISKAAVEAIPVVAEQLRAEAVASSVLAPAPERVASAVPEPSIAASVPVESAVAAMPTTLPAAQAVESVASAPIERPMAAASALEGQAAAPVMPSAIAALPMETTAQGPSEVLAQSASAVPPVQAVAPSAIATIAMPVGEGAIAAMSPEVAVPPAPVASATQPVSSGVAAVALAPEFAGAVVSGNSAQAAAPVSAIAPVAIASSASSVVAAGTAQAVPQGGGVAALEGQAASAAPSSNAVVVQPSLAGPVGAATADSVSAPSVAAEEVTVAALPQTTTVEPLLEPEPIAPTVVLPGLEEVSAFIDGYGDQTCLAAVAENNASGVAALTSYGTVASLEGFTAQAKANFGDVLPIDARVISNSQCWLLDMLGAWRRYWDPNFDITLVADRVANGGTVNASITNVASNWLYVLLVDDEGKVTDLADYVTANGGGISLAAPVTATGAGERRLQLLVAMTTPTSLVSIDQHRGETAQSFFEALQQELKTRQIRPQLSITAFSVY